MVQERLDDGRRIAQLVASELTGDRDRLGRVVVVDADPAVEPTPEGARAYRVVHVEGAAITTDDRGRRSIDPDARAEPTDLATAALQPTRVRIEFASAPAIAAAAAEDAGLRVRPKAVDPPRTLVFVEDGADAKRVLGVVRRVVEAVEAGERERD